MEPKDYQYPRMEVRGCRARGSSFRGWRLWSQRLRVSENRGLGEWSPRASKVRGGGARGSSLRGQRLRVSEDRGLGEWSPRAFEVRGCGARGSSLREWRLWGHRVWAGNLQYPTHNMNYGFFSNQSEWTLYNFLNISFSFSNTGESWMNEALLDSL